MIARGVKPLGYGAESITPSKSPVRGDTARPTNRHPHCSWFSRTRTARASCLKPRHRVIQPGSPAIFSGAAAQQARKNHPIANSFLIPLATYKGTEKRRRSGKDGRRFELRGQDSWRHGGPTAQGCNSQGQRPIVYFRLRVLLCSRVSRLRWLFGFGALMSCILLFDRPQLLAEIS